MQRHGEISEAMLIVSLCERLADILLLLLFFFLKTEMDDSEYMYELFSVIIHKGGCYGGHYHVYIRDVDELGNWQLQVSAKWFFSLLVSYISEKH